MKIERVRRMRLRDVLVIQIAGWDQAQEGDPTLESGHALAKGLEGVVDIPIIILDSSITLQSLSEAQMAQAGWIRANSRVASTATAGGTHE